MKRRLLALCLLVAVVAAACGSRDDNNSSTTTTGGGGSTSSTQPTEPTEATEIGITKDEIRIAVLADVDNAIVPGLFQGSKDAMEAFGTWINDNGGIAGRKLVVDFIDTKLNPNETKTAMQKACENNFALVGTTAVFFQTVDPIVQCKDINGDTTGIPDLAAISAEPAQQLSPVTFSPLPPERVYPEGDTQKFRVRVGAQQWLLENVNSDLHGVWLQAADSKTATNGNIPRFYVEQNILGMKKDAEFPVSGFAAIETYGPYVQALKDNNSNYAESGGGYQATIKFRKAAAQQGVDVEVWFCVLTCYDQGFLDEGGKDVEDTYVGTPFLPFFNAEDRAAVPALQEFVDAVGADKADGFGLQAWAAGLLLRDSINAIVESSGVNGITRAALLEQLANTNEFDADGLIGPTDVGKRIPSPCNVVLQVRDGAFERLDPTEPGKFNCDADNLVEVEKDLQS